MKKLTNAHQFPAHRKLTQDELTAEALAAFGGDPLDIAFRCPNCGDVATIRDHQDAGDANAAGQHCIGRTLGARSDGWTGRGCNWAAYGLFCGPWEIVMPAEDGLPERSAWSFPLALDAAGGAR